MIPLILYLRKLTSYAHGASVTVKVIPLILLIWRLTGYAQGAVVHFPSRELLLIADPVAKALCRLWFQFSPSHFRNVLHSVKPKRVAISCILKTYERWFHWKHYFAGVLFLATPCNTSTKILDSYNTHCLIKNAAINVSVTDAKIKKNLYLNKNRFLNLSSLYLKNGEQCWIIAVFLATFVPQKCGQFLNDRACENQQPTAKVTSHGLLKSISESFTTVYLLELSWTGNSDSFSSFLVRSNVSGTETEGDSWKSIWTFGTRKACTRWLHNPLTITTTY